MSMRSPGLQPALELAVEVYLLCVSCDRGETGQNKDNHRQQERKCNAAKTSGARTHREGCMSGLPGHPTLCEGVA